VVCSEGGPLPCLASSRLLFFLGRVLQPEQRDEVRLDHRRVDELGALGLRVVAPDEKGRLDQRVERNH